MRKSEIQANKPARRVGAREKYKVCASTNTSGCFDHIISQGENTTVAV